MRRISFAIVSTLAALVLLFSYKTSGPGTATAESSSVAHIVSGPSAGASQSGTTSSATPSSGTTAAAPPDPAASTSSAKGTTRAKSPTSSTPGTSQAPASTAPVVVDGSAVNTQYGPVQVEVTITGGKITSVQAIDYPNGNGRDAQINSYAVPQLESQAVSAQSAKIDGVSGATYTSEGFVQSLQSALDAANFGG
ncbi:FMN-binding protein [Nakamurella silvestris]|nr:FMN-binding protein [Nakamurella silvestris]